MSTNHNIIKLRRGTEAQWAASQPQPGGEVLKLAEPGYEKDTRRLKIGDGVTPWNSLPYFGNGAVFDEESIQDLLGDGDFLIAGTNISLNYNDSENTLTINNTQVIDNYGNNRLLTSDGTSTGIYAEEFFRFDTTTKSLLIESDTTDPATGPWIVYSAYGNETNSKGARLVGRRYQGSKSSPLPADANDTLLVVRGDSMNATGVIQPSCRILMKANGNANAEYSAVPGRIEIATSSGPNSTDNTLIFYSSGLLYHNGHMTIDNGLSAPTPILSLGAVSGNTAINYGSQTQIQTLTLNGTAVNFTKGTGWGVSNRSYEVMLVITVTSTTTVAFDGGFVTDWFSTLPTFTAGTYQILIRNFGNSNIHGHYLGKKV